MTIQTSTPATLGWMINLMLLMGLLLFAAGLYLVAGIGWAALLCGLCLMAVALYVTRLYFWSLNRVHTPAKSGEPDR